MTKETTWVEWLTGRLEDWLSGWLAAEWQTNWITNWLTDWLSDWLLTDGLPDWLINWMTEWMADRLTGWHTDLSLVKIDKICLVWVSLVALTCCSQNDIAPQTYLGQRHLPVEAKLRQETEASLKRRPYDICKYKNNVYQWRIYIPIDPQFENIQSSLWLSSPLQYWIFDRWQCNSYLVTRWASVWVSGDVDFDAQLSSNCRFLSDIVAY